MFREATCSKCHEVIQVPDDKEKILCMYCGAEILVEEALGNKREKTSPEQLENSKNLVLEDLRNVITNCDNPIKDFKRTIYPDKIAGFVEEHKKTFDTMDLVYRESSDSRQWLEEMAACLIETARQQMEQCKSRSKKNQLQIDHNFLITIYLVPAVLAAKYGVSEPFADCLIESWNRTFHTTLGKATVEEINGGFRKKLCYITTAVCEGAGKGSDCYELQLLKDYRDQYLDVTEEGHQLVMDYYDIAPTIVKRMGREADREQLYEKLYQQYILPCIEKIENKEYEACQELYTKMVLYLKAKYLN